jgi:hypothetical protein
VTAATLLDTLRGRGLELSDAGGRLEVRPAGRLTPAERGAIRSRLSELLALLAWDQATALRDMDAADTLVERLGVPGSDPRVQAAADAIAAAYAARDVVAFRFAIAAFRECVRRLAGLEHS